MNRTMNIRHFLAISAIALGLASGAASAQGPSRQEEPARQERPHQAPKTEKNPRAEQGKKKNSSARPAARPEAHAHQGRGAGPDQRIRKGDRLPPAYRGKQYVVDNWRAHKLSPPPKGHHWVQTGGDYVLVKVSSGIVIQLSLGH